MSFYKSMIKKYGDDQVFSFDNVNAPKYHIIPFNLPSLDYESGVGGIPTGRIIELYGDYSAGKSTVSNLLIKSAQALAKLPGFFKGKRVLLIDVENAADKAYLKKMGLDLSEETGLIIARPDSGEDAFDIMEAACLSGEISLIITDSVPALLPIKMMENDMDYNPIGLQARMISLGMNKLKGIASKTNTACVFINQTRVDVGKMHGNPETTPGGKALSFYATMRIRLARNIIVKGKDKIGQTIRASFEKNKVSAPFTKTEFNYFFDSGIDMHLDIAKLSNRLDIFSKSGSWFYLGESMKTPDQLSDGTPIKFNGETQLADAFRQHFELFLTANTLIKKRLDERANAAFIEEEFDSEEEARILAEAEQAALV